MSCTQGFNKDLFLSQVGEMGASLKGKKIYKLKYDSMEHTERVNWLRSNARLENVNETMEVSDDGKYITLAVLLDNVVFQRYLKEFEPEMF